MIAIDYTRLAKWEAELLDDSDDEYARQQDAEYAQWCAEQQDAEYRRHIEAERRLHFGTVFEDDAESREAGW